MIEYSSSKMRQALCSLEWAKVEHLLKTLPGDHLSFARLLDDLIKSGCLILRYRDEAKILLRQSFFSNLKAFFVAHQKDAVPSLDEHFSHVESIEGAYWAILSSLSEANISSFSPKIQIWSAMQAACEGIEEVHHRVFQQFAKRDSSSVSLISTTIINKAGEHQNADSLIGRYAEVLYATLLMAATSQKWFSNKTLMIPSPDENQQSYPDLSRANTYLASAWTMLKGAEEHLRLFGGSLSCTTKEIVDDFGSNALIKIVAFDLDLTHQKYETIARERFDDIVSSWHLHMLTLSDQDLDPLVMDTAPLAPDGYISREEMLIASVFQDVLRINLSHRTSTAHELCVAEWLRGYSVLKSYCLEGVFRFLPLGHSKLIEDLKLQGMSEQAASLFLELVTLSRGHRDLYDAPLIKDDSGTLWLFAPLFRTANLIHVITSQMGSAKIVAREKGENAEESLRNLFSERGIPVKEIKFEHGGANYQCDAVVVWQNHLFVFEVKNHLIPLGTSVPYSYMFWQQLGEDVQQCKRIASDLLSYPELLSQHFGQDCVYDGYHPVLVHSMPFIVDTKIDGVSLCDLSALERIFHNPDLTIDTTLHKPDGSLMLVKHKVGSLWKDNEISVDDLLTAIESPLQIRFSPRNWRVLATPLRLSNSMMIAIPILDRAEDTKEDFLISLGYSEKEASIMLNHINETMAAMQSDCINVEEQPPH